MKLFSNSGKYSSEPKSGSKNRTSKSGSVEVHRRPTHEASDKPLTLEERTAARKAAAQRETRGTVRKSPAAESKPARVRKEPAQVVTDNPVQKIHREQSQPASIKTEAVPAPAEARPHNQKSHKNSKAKQKHQNRSIFLGAVAIFCVIMIVTFLFLGLRKWKAERSFREIAKTIESYEKEEFSGLSSDDSFTPTTDMSLDGDQIPLDIETAPKTILQKYADLYLRNSEFFGWVKIDDTRINYPVMRSFEDNDEYLYANFDGKYSYSGIPFADIKCSHDSDNILIYAHNMKDGTLFRDLMKYEKESYWKKHPTVMFSDLYDDYEYEVLAAFYDRVYLKSDDCFKFYQFIDAADKAEFDYAIDQFKEKSIYDTGVDAEYGDKLITLVTCAYHVDNGRFVVVARRK